MPAGAVLEGLLPAHTCCHACKRLAGWDPASAGQPEASHSLPARPCSAAPSRCLSDAIRCLPAPCPADVFGMLGPAGAQVLTVKMLPCSAQQPHWHPNADETVFVLKGRGGALARLHAALCSLAGGAQRRGCLPTPELLQCVVDGRTQAVASAAPSLLTARSCRRSCGRGMWSPFLWVSGALEALAFRACGVCTGGTPVAARQAAAHPLRYAAPPRNDARRRAALGQQPGLRNP